MTARQFALNYLKTKFMVNMLLGLALVCGLLLSDYASPVEQQGGTQTECFNFSTGQIFSDAGRCK